MAAYGFARFTTKGISIAFAFVIATMLIPEIVTARPLYEFMRTVGLYDTHVGLIILYISAGNSFYGSDPQEFCHRNPGILRGGSCH